LVVGQAAILDAILRAVVNPRSLRLPTGVQGFNAPAVTILPRTVTATQFHASALRLHS
jgi:hypothetical protein